MTVHGRALSIEHALSCAKGGFPTIRHNEIRDLTADLLTEVCNDIRIESDLQPITEQTLIAKKVLVLTSQQMGYGEAYLKRPI